MDATLKELQEEAEMSPSFPQYLAFLGAKKRLYKRLRWSVRWSVGWSVGPYVPISLRKLVTSQLLQEEEEEENWLRRFSFAPRD
jgi:hypothetical protein